MKILIIDNYDSFTYNLFQLIEQQFSGPISVLKSDKVSLKDVKHYDKILISPGPGLPYDYPLIFEILDTFKNTKSILGICLGHQAIGVYFGAKLINLKKVSHGQKKIAKIIENDYLFNNIPKRFPIGLYHSWVLSEKDFSEQLSITAISEDKLIMGIAHKNFDIRGIQFHPESIITKYGDRILSNWLNYNLNN